MLVPIYRVYKDNHNSQFFFTRSCAEDMAHAKNAEWNIVYKKDLETARQFIEKANIKLWQKGVNNEKI